MGYDVPLNTYIDIKAKELPEGSGTKIKVQCSYCGNIFDKAYRRYLETKDDLCCNNCKAEKIIKLSLLKYNNRCSLRNPDIERKIIENNLRKYGYEFPLQSEEVRRKAHESYLKNCTGELTRSSKNQIAISKLFGAKLNVPIGPYFADMILNDNIIIEYYGTGHDLNVRLGHMTKEQFEEKENIRNKYMINNGYKIARIIHNSEILPSKSVLLKLKKSILRDLEHNDIVFYNLGEFESQIA